MFDLDAIQAALQHFQIDAWLLYEFRGSNLLAHRVLDLEAAGTRRFFYCIPARGEPQKLVHRIESKALDHLPGQKRVYLKWQELEEGVKELVEGHRQVAMEYSPRAANPYISRVDAGTVELVKSYGVDVISSGDLVQQFEATWDESQWQMHQEVALHTDAAFERAWSFLVDRIRKFGMVRETEVQAEILAHFEQNGLTTSHPPTVAVGPHSSDPHYEPLAGRDAPIKKGDFVLIDLWAKLKKLRAVYSDVTRVAFVGEVVPPRYEEIFQIVARARDTAISLIEEAFAQGRSLEGWQVDQAARDVIEQAGYGQYFVHRTGHSLGEETHGNGANMDNLEMRDQRRVLPATAFSIEPGIYLDKFGVRSEVNVFIDGEGRVHVTGGEPQKSVLPLLAEP